MADSTTESDLDSVIDRLLEGELSRLLPRRWRSPDRLARARSARQPSWQARAAAGVRDKVSVYQGEGNFHQPAYFARVGGTYQDMWYVVLLCLQAGPASLSPSL